MQEYTTQLVRKKEIVENTIQYDFAKPEGFIFTAGQYMIVGIVDPQETDEKPSFRSLSIASAPYENVLSFIMRHSDSAFKKNLSALAIGDVITVKGPLGHMALPEDETVPVMFLAAGVGITPARAMIRHAAHEHITNPMTLLYSNRVKESAACADELKDVALPTYHCVNVITDEATEWGDEHGFITAEMIAKYAPAIPQTQFYVIGTTGFVHTMKEALATLGVTKDQLHIDNFG